MKRFLWPYDLSIKRQAEASWLEHKREFVYCFNEDEGAEERQIDLSGKMRVPKKGEFLSLRQKEWQVVKVTFDVIMDEDKLVVNVHLTDKYRVS